MDIHVLHDARAVAGIAGVDAPACESIALSMEDPSQVLFSFVGGNPLDPGWLIDLDLPATRIACWSGTLADGDDLFAAHPHNWMSPGGDALRGLLEQLLPQFEQAGRTICLIPHARHLVSDVQGTINLARAHAGSALEIALAPASLLVPSMLETLEDHLERSFSTLSETASFLLIEDLMLDEEGDRLVPAAFGEGVLDLALLRNAIARHWPIDKPIVLRPGNLPEQLDWLKGE
ncbi:MAG: hypothetical protein VX641_03745 [Planctomycetota bacterium]|nr:hypothetical protein [Planctomycetota bacterium]